MNQEFVPYTEFMLVYAGARQLGTYDPKQEVMTEGKRFLDERVEKIRAKKENLRVSRDESRLSYPMLGEQRGVEWRGNGWVAYLSGPKDHCRPVDMFDILAITTAFPHYQSMQPEEIMMTSPYVQMDVPTHKKQEAELVKV